MVPDAAPRNVKGDAPAGKRRIAVIGAGLAGLVAATRLHRRGHEVVVVEKARGPGGRMSTRRAAGARFDHGAQYFTARDPRFLRRAREWQSRGFVQPWNGRIGAVGNQRVTAKDGGPERFVGVPGMSAVCRELAAALPDCRFGWRVHAVQRTDCGWTLQSAGGAALEAAALLVTAPPEQTRVLLPDPAVKAALEGVELRPCWAVLVVCDRPLLPGWDGLFVNEGPLAWLAAQAGKPGRSSAHAWVLHAAPDWSEAHLEDPVDQVCMALLDAAGRLPGAQQVEIEYATAHRWRFAQAREPLAAGALDFPDRGLVLAGDWCHGSKVEGAFLSGIAAAVRLEAAARLDQGRRPPR
jgi:predicted NAD/FAD-dependent oxidoreductase